MPCQQPLDTRSRLCLHRIAWPRKPTPGIKQRVASYHTTKVIAHKASYSNGISISAAVFAGLTSVTDRPTGHATWSITIGRIYICSTTMRPNNNNNNVHICLAQNKKSSDALYHIDGTIQDEIVFTKTFREDMRPKIYLQLLCSH